MELPEDLERDFDEAVVRYEEDKKMPYITSVERIGIQIQQGILQNAREAVIEALEARFEELPKSIVEAINGLGGPSVLKTLLRSAVTVDSLKEFKEVLSGHS